MENITISSNFAYLLLTLRCQAFYSWIYNYVFYSELRECSISKF